MNKNILFSLIFLFLISMCSCTVEAGPGEITLSTGAVEPTKLTTPTGNTGVHDSTIHTEGTDDWENHGTFSLLRNPPGNVLGFELSGGRHYAWLGEVTEDDFLKYWQTLLDDGFSLYCEERTFYIGSQQCYDFAGRNAEGLIIDVVFGDIPMHISSVPEDTIAYISIYDARTANKSEDGIVKPWGIDEYQQHLPEPYPAYVSGTVFDYTYNGEYTEFYRLDLNAAMSYNDGKAYIQALQDFGYTLEETIVDRPFMDQLSFSAKNDEGYFVTLTVYSNSAPMLILYGPEMNGPGREWNDDAFRSCLPEPPATDYTQYNTSFVSNRYEFILEGMDYAAAKAYVDALKEKGYTKVSSLQDNSTAETLEFVASGEITGAIMPGNTEPYTGSFIVTLLYDPTYVLEDGTPYCIVRLK